MEQSGDITSNPTREHIAQATQEIADAEAKAENKAFRRRRYEEVRQYSDDILLAVEGVMLINKREKIGRELTSIIKGLFFEVNDVLDLIPSRASDRQLPRDYPDTMDFTAREASSIILNFEQKRLFNAGTGYKFAMESDDKDFFLVEDEEIPEHDYLGSQSKAS